MTSPLVGAWWATVTQVSPLRIQRDGDDAALPITPDSLIPAPPVGTRVWVVQTGQRITVVGMPNLVLPAASVRGLYDLAGGLVNGGGAFGDNTNFSLFAYSTDAPPAATPGAFLSAAAGPQALACDQLVPYSPSLGWRFGFQARQVGSGSGNMYGWIGPVDVDRQSIQPQHYMYVTGTLVTLTADLSPGDSVVHVSDASAWYGSSSKPASTNVRALQIWDWVDGHGRAWTPGTYTRNVEMYAWADGAVDTSANSITLATPWAGPVVPAGTYVSNGVSGGSYLYMPACTNVPMPTSWTLYTGELTGVQADSDHAVNAASGGAGWTSGPPSATAYLQVGWLANYSAAGTSQLAVADVSMVPTPPAIPATTLAPASGWTIRSGFQLTVREVLPGWAALDGQLVASAAHASGTQVLAAGTLPGWARPSAYRALPALDGAYSSTSTPNLEVHTDGSVVLYDGAVVSGGVLKITGIYPI